MFTKIRALNGLTALFCEGTSEIEAIQWTNQNASQVDADAKRGKKGEGF